MDGAKIQSKVYYGYQQAAARVGMPHGLYRSTDLFPPLENRNYLGDINAAMTVATASNFNFARPSLLKDSAFACLADGKVLMVGDYLQRNSDSVVFFIGAMEPIMPIVAVRCNGSISYRRRPSAGLKPGLNTYQGPVLAAETDVVDNIPAAIILQSSGRNTNANGLPSDAPGPLKFSILLSPTIDPQMHPVVGDTIWDDEGRRFLVGGVGDTPIALFLDVVHLVS